MTNLTTHEQLILASTVASRAHKNQKRKDGTPYIGHPMRVCMRVVDQGNYCMIAALLHDVVEDTEITLSDLRELGFESMVIEMVDRLTHRSGETYSDFIDRCGKHDLARLVKIADIEDNISDQSALDPDEATFLKNRYEKALTKLS